MTGAPTQAYNSRPLKSNQDLNLEPDPEDNTIGRDNLFTSDEQVVEDDTKLSDII